MSGLGLTVAVISLVFGTVTSNSQLSDQPFYSPIQGDFCSTR